jgi:monovalent cation:H+ antiporter, CPA1 family
MANILIAIISILLLSRILQAKLFIPLPIGIMSLTLGVYSFFPEHINISAEANFDGIILMLLPLVLLPDTLNFKISDLKKHAVAIFYLSFVAVVLSILIGVLFNFVIFSEYAFTTGALISLFAMVLATDAVSVGSIFSQFKLPHSLKVLTEGESLFNDATAVIAFFFIGLPLMNGVEVTPADVGVTLLRVLSVSVIIGFIVGYFGKLLLSMLHTVTDEFIVILLVAYVAFGIAENHHIHVSGILALISAVLTLKYFINKQFKAMDSSNAIISSDEAEVSQKTKVITTQARLDENKQIIAFFALFANAVLFFTLAELIEIDKILLYSKEIITLFLATTIIRAAMMLKFSFISRKMEKVTDVSYRWWAILTFAGIKGGLSMIMVHALPASFVHKAMFEQIVMGIILLSIFVYSLGLIFVIKRYQEAFIQDMKDDAH